MYVCLRHIDAACGHHIIEKSTLSIQTIAIPPAKVNTNSNIQAGLCYQRSSVTGPARGGIALLYPLSYLLLRIIRHIFNLALGQSSFAHQLIDKFKVRPSQICNRCIQNQYIRSHTLLSQSTICHSEPFAFLKDKLHEESPISASQTLRFAQGDTFKILSQCISASHFPIPGL